MEVKIIANYLPQYHEIPENSQWWGEGFTDWVSVKRAKPLFSGHVEPRIPMNGNYYSLDDISALRWQANLARQYGIYGFGIYHYWFNSKMNLLTKPVELLRDNKDVDIHFFFIWDNVSWKRTWSNVRKGNDWAPQFDVKKSTNQNEDSGILAELIYGDESEWKKHFDYLLPFFKDERYIKIDNKPVFAFFQPQNDYDTIKKMVEFWNKEAINNGFDGIACVSKDNRKKNDLEYKMKYSPFSPGTNRYIYKYIFMDYLAKFTKRIRFFDYDRCWKELLDESKKADQKTFLSGFVQFDDTPRRGSNGRIVRGATPEKFEKYMKRLLDLSKKQRKEFVFVTAWNEWGEGAYLEPDECNKYEYLEALKRAMESCSE